MSQWKIKAISYAIVVFVLEFLSIFIGFAFQALNQISNLGMDIQGDVFQSIYLSYLLSPLRTIGEMITEPNPVYLMCVIGSFALGIFMLKGSESKSYQVESKYAVHGSQRWATYDEIVKYKQINAFSKKEILKNMTDSIAEEEEAEESENAS